ncbi:MAG TPA: endo-1,4-beta-xylanase, partial [Polyangiaceae bacterium]|nr:endo-1,4-beta-xylanase [Polyangiaceae bacterium]
NAIKTAGAPIDAVGAQSHDVAKTMMSAATLQTNLNTLNTMTGLPVYITEYDVSYADDPTQLMLYQQQFPVFMNTSFVHGITIWGWIYGQTWSQAPDSGLVKNGVSRSAMTWLMQQLGRPAP